MEIQQLRTFVAVAHSGSVTRATRTLFLSQPAVSGQIKALEDELAVELFRRTAHGMELTAAGQALLPLAERVLSAGAELTAKASSLAGSLAGRVQIGIAGHPGELRLPELLQRAYSEHAAIVLEFHHGSSGEVQEDVLRRHRDAGFVIGPVSSPELAQHRLGSLSVYVAAPVAWRDEIKARGWERIYRSPWVVGAEDSFCGKVARERVGNGGRVIEVDHPGAVLELITAGVCAGLLHEDEAVQAEISGTVLLWREQRITADLMLIWSRGAQAGTPADAILHLVRDLWG